MSNLFSKGATSVQPQNLDIHTADLHRPLDPAQVPLSHFALEEVGRSLRQDAVYQNTGKNSRSLIRSQSLTMVLTALQKGSRLNEHHAPGPATALVLEGELLFSSPGPLASPAQTDLVLGAHQCAVFAGGLLHSVQAREETLLLIIIGEKSTST